MIFVVDWWEKLAGASLALTGMVQLCKASGMALVEPFVHSSMFRPFPQPESLPLDAYYELEPIRAAVRLVTYARWEAHAAATPPRQKTAVLLVWSDFPKECVSALPLAVLGLSSPHLCPPRALQGYQTRRAPCPTDAAHWALHGRRRPTAGGADVCPVSVVAAFFSLRFAAWVCFHAA